MDHFDVAHMLGHPAFNLLSQGLRIYTELNQKSWLSTERHAWSDCFFIAGELSCCRKNERSLSVQSTILFQAMMEKIPYFVSGFGNGLNPLENARINFCDSWTQLLDQIVDEELREKAKAAFGVYKTSIYNEVRNPVIHGKSGNDLLLIEAVRAPNIHEGMRQGWIAYDCLLKTAFEPDQRHESSWSTMCELHHMPETLSAEDYPDLELLERSFNKKHLDGARAAVEL